MSARKKQTRAARRRGGVVIEDNPAARPDLDPAVAEQLTMMILTSARQSMELNATMDRNMVANASAVLTLGVQQINMAGLNLLTSVSPVEAAAAANFLQDNDPRRMAALNLAAQIPHGRTAG